MLVTFGIKPSYPATSYGYIETGEQLSENCWSAVRFKEKPDRQTAELYLKTGNFYWNSGIFAWNLKTITSAFQKYQPQIWERIGMIKEDWRKKGKFKDITTLYKGMPRIPIDIGIMEKSDRIAVIPTDFGWSDVGGWKALYEVAEKDENGNVFLRDNLCIDSHDNYVYSEKLVSLIGVNNLVIISTEDALLVADKERTEEVKKLVDMLIEKNRTEFL
jgi:mannose-1-phosphate guanylyltransferase/mannose-6-phosphate isomerase